MTTVGWVVAFAAVAIVIAMCAGLFLGYRIVMDLKEKIEHPLVQMPAPQPAPQVNVNMKPVEDLLKALPNKVLQSIQSSVNTKKGALGELIGYIELEAQYDRIVPLGNIVDFMCIKFPVNEQEGRIDFVDIKTGKSSRLSKDQRVLQQLVKDKKINFVKLSVNTQTSENFGKAD